MNRFYKILGAALLGMTSFSSTAQTVFSENFNSSASLANWTLLDLDGNTPQANYAFFTDAFISFPDPDSSVVGDTCVASTSWFTPAGTANDYMISPSMLLPQNAVLSFDVRASDANFPDGYQVLISTTTPDTAGLNANPVLLNVPAATGVWTNRTVDLSAYAGQTVHLAIRNNSTDMNILLIDNFVVSVVPAFEVELLATNRLSEYTQVPSNQTDSIVFAAIVGNNGTDTLKSLKVNYSVKRGSTVVYTDSSALASLAPNATNTFVKLANYMPTMTGVYTVDYVVSHSNVDATLSNNMGSSDTLIVTDTTIARDNGIATGSLGIGAGIKGELGSVYAIANSDTLTSVSVFIRNATGSMTNQPVSAQVRSFSNGLPGSILATTDTITYTNTGASYASLTFNNAGGYVILPADSFFVGVEEQDSNITIGTTPTKFIQNTNFVTFGTTPWTPNENFNFNVTYMIRPNFGTPRTVTVGNNEILSATSAIKVYPNPSNGFITLNITDENKIGTVQVEVYDITGKVVYNNNFSGANTVQEQIDLSGLNNGMYFLRTNINGNNTIQKVTIK